MEEEKKIPKPTLENPGSEFKEINVPQSVYIAIAGFLVALVMGVIALVTAVLGSMGGG